MTSIAHHQISATLIWASNRVVAGSKKTDSSGICQRLREAGIVAISERVAAEDSVSIAAELTAAIAAGSRLIIVCGASGISAGNDAPEVVAQHCVAQLPGIAEHIRAHGLKNTHLAALSRQVVGITAKGPEGALLLNSPSSAGGISDTLDVLIPLLPAIFRQLSPQP